ncbi:MAG: universal stress protein A [Planctomycetota bacterium]|jgi:universal stress protein A
MNIKKLVVAVDFSKPSIQALQVAIDLSQQLQSAIYIVYAADMDDKSVSTAQIGLDETVEMKVFKDLKHQLHALVEKMSNGKTEVIIEVEYGDPTEGIVRLAAKVNADIIVMGTHGRTGIEHLLIGSVAENVLRKAEIPVLCVRA